MLNFSTDGDYIPVYAFKNRSNDSTNMTIYLKNNQAPKAAYFRVAFPERKIFESGTKIRIDRAFLTYFINSKSGFPSYYLQVLEYDVAEDDQIAQSEFKPINKELKEELPFL